MAAPTRALLRIITAGPVDEHVNDALEAGILQAAPPDPVLGFSHPLLREAAEGMLTDPVYEGKSMHGMVEMVRRGEFRPGSKVLYAHLGGVPALNAYSFLFRNG